MKERKLSKILLSWLLCLGMIVSIFPVDVLAEESSLYPAVLESYSFITNETGEVDLQYSIRTGSDDNGFKVSTTIEIYDGETRVYSGSLSVPSSATPGMVIPGKIASSKLTNGKGFELYKTYTMNIISKTDLEEATRTNTLDCMIDVAHSGKGWALDTSGCLTLYGEIENPSTSSIDGTPWRSYKSSITKVVALPGASIDSGIDLFYNCENLKSIDLSNLDTSKVEDMSYMFEYCSAIETLDLSGFDTSNVTDMKVMFYKCSSLTSLNVNSFDTSKVEDMSFMFECCENLKSIDVSNFNTTNVRKMYSMFNECQALESLDISHFNTSNVFDMSYMFYECNNLKNVDVSHLDTSKVEDMSYMFYECNNLKNVDVSHFNTAEVEYMDNMFDGCNSLESLDVTNFDTSKVKVMDFMFKDCHSLQALDVSSFNTKNVVKMSYMFDSCKSLESLDLHTFDFSSAENIAYMFADCDNLKNLDISNFSSSSLTKYDDILYHCNKLEVYKGNADILEKSVDNLMDLYPEWVNKETRTVYTDENKEELLKLTGSFTLYKHVPNYTKYVSLGGGKHVVMCADCDQIQPGHESDYCSGGLSTCKEKARCEKCGAAYGDLGTHIYSTAWASDGTNHYHKCTVCGDKKDVAAHTLTNVTTKATLTANGKVESKCSVCDKVTKTTTIYYPKTIKLSATSYTYDGKVKKPSVIVKDSKGNTISTTNYTVIYPTGRKVVGKYTVKVTFKNKYKGTKSLTFKINPPKTTISSLTPKSKSFIVKWAKKSAQVTGYQIQYSTTSGFTSGNKTATVTSYKTVSKTIKSLKAKKKYYVRVRTYKTVNKVKFYSGYSAKKYVTTKA